MISTKDVNVLRAIDDLLNAMESDHKNDSMYEYLNTFKKSITEDSKDLHSKLAGSKRRSQALIARAVKLLRELINEERRELNK